MGAFGQPFYNYGSNPYGSQNNGYAQQQPQYGNFYGQPQNVPHNANNGVTQQYQQQVQQQAALPPKTNVPLATSLIDAMSRNAEFNTEIFYADQDNPFIYKIMIDGQGRKTHRVFKIEDVTEQTAQQSNGSATPDIDLSGYATKDDLQALKDEIMGMASAFVAQQAVSPTQQPAKTKSADKPKVDKE